MEEGGFVLMNLSKFKRWTALLHRVIVKKQNREQTHPVCLHAVEKYEKVEGIFFFFSLFRVGLFIRSLPYGSWFCPTWNLSPLLGLS